VAKSNPGTERAPTKAERRARSLANLEKYKIKKGEVRNPTGKNGRARSDYVVGLLEEQDKHGVSHIRRIVMAQIKRAERGSDVAGKTLIDHYKGKARIEIDHTSSDRSMSPNRKPTTAETRQELDRVLAAIDRRAGAPAPAGPADAAPANSEGGGEAKASEPKATP